MHFDLIATRDRLRRGQSSASEEAERSITLAGSPGNRHTFLKTMFAQAQAQAHAWSVAARSQGPQTSLAGLAVSVKDLFDIAGQATAAGSVVLEDAPAALRDSMAVARLKAAGGIVLGRTNMSEFAFSGVGTNPHFGTPANPADPDLARIPGGSSSGAAVSVATGAAFIGLGSDTGGSIRIPAALCGIVGFKNTARLTPLLGVLPLSSTLDTVCALTRSGGDAVGAPGILAARVVVRSTAPLAGYRLAVARTTLLDGLDAAVGVAFERGLDLLRAAGARIDDIALSELGELGAMNATGGFSAAESYAWHRTLLAKDAGRYDARVRLRIERGAAMKAHEYLDLIGARRDWIVRVEAALRGFDAVLSPTVPLVAPPIAQVAPGASGHGLPDTTRDEEFFRINALLLRNPSIVNMLDGCAISIPCQAAGDLPVGLMIWNGALRDDTVLNIALAAEAALKERR